MKKVLYVALALILVSTLAGCGNIGPVSSNQPTPMQTPSASSTIAPSPSATATPAREPSPVPPEDTPFTGDLPAYVQAGLPAREKMSDIERWYYYEEETPGTDAENDELYFETGGKADLDGDGKEDVIQFLPGRPVEETEGQYSSVIVDINGSQLVIDEYYAPIPAGGEIIDIDREDGKKEIVLIAEEDIGCSEYLISYDSGKTSMLYHEWGGIFTSGTGYILGWCVDESLKGDSNIYYEYLLKLRKDRSGFDTEKTKYYRSSFTMYFRELNQYAQTEWNEKLAKEPGGKRDIPVPKGTMVLQGLYDGNGWVQFIDEKGNSLGWLDARKADFDKYTNNAFDAGD